MNVLCMSVTMKPQNEEALSHWGLSRNRKKNKLTSQSTIVLLKM